MLFYSCSDNEYPIIREYSQPTETRAIYDDSCGYAGLVQKQFNTCGITRYYYIQTPDAFEPTASYPLLLVFHGKGSGNKNKACVWKERIGDWINEKNYIAVYCRSYDDFHWYIEDACLSEVDEICYVQTIINNMKSNYNIIDNKIYAMGTSNGGALCQDLVREMDDFAAIASFAAYKWESYDFGTVPKIPLMQVHGSEDNTIPYSGGDIFCLEFENAFVACHDWSVHNGCLKPPATPSVTISGNTIDLAAWCSKKYIHLSDTLGCRKCRKEVVHYRLNGIGHTIYDDISDIPGYREYINDELFAFFHRNKF